MRAPYPFRGFHREKGGAFSCAECMIPGLEMFKDKQPETGQTFNDKRPKSAQCWLMYLHFFEGFASEFTVYNENAAENLAIWDIFLQRIVLDFAKCALLTRDFVVSH